MGWSQIYEYKNMEYISHGFLKFKYHDRINLGNWFGI